MKRFFRLSKISIKSILKNNNANKMLLLCISLLIFIPTFLYNTTESIVNAVKVQKETVYGIFTEIYYRDLTKDFYPVTSEQFKMLIPEFQYDNYGVFYTVKMQEIGNNRILNLGYADLEAIRLGCLSLSEGTFPKEINEIALTAGVVGALGDYKVGQEIVIDGKQYILCGIVNDFGRFWPHGNKQIEDNISPVNAFITESKAQEFYDEDFGVLQQIVIKSKPNIINGIQDTERLFSNNKAGLGTIYEVPESFRLLMYIISVFIIVTVLMLGKNKRMFRLKNYYLLGLEKRDIKWIMFFEMIFIMLIGTVLGLFFSFIASHICLMFVLNRSGSSSIFVFSNFKNMILILSMLLGFLMIFAIFSNYIVKKLSLESEESVKIYKLTEKKISILKFDLKQNVKVLIFIAVLISLTCTLIAYGITYKNYFSEEIESEQGYVINDYDFQFVSTVPPAAPLSKDPETDEYPIPLFFTDPYEKIGANQNFLDYVNSIDGISRVIAYRENPKMNILIKTNKIDEYFDGMDTVIDGSYDMQQRMEINDLEKFRRTFGYENDDLLISSEIVGYTPEEIEKLKSVVIDGEINIEKLMSGEEVILRVPAYQFVETNFDSMVLIGVTPADYTDSEAINSTMYKVGDEIILSGIMTDEFINGAVIDQNLSDFYRLDAKAKIGAIIRSFDGVLYTSKVGAAACSVITVNSAFDELNIPALYSVISIYTDIHADNELIATELESEGLSLPYMIFENWSSDVQNYKIYNLLIGIFSVTFVCILVAVAFILLLSQFYMKTNLSLSTYALYRINGLPFHSLLLSCFVQVVITYLIGATLSIPITITLLKASMKILNIKYFLPIDVHAAVIGSVLLILLVSLIPSVILLYKRKNNVVMDVI